MLNDYGISFDGRRVVHPGAYDKISASGMIMSSPGSANVPIVVGSANAGKPNEIKWFTNADAAKAYFRGGDLPAAIEMMFSPIPEGGGGASVVGALMINDATQATQTGGGATFTSLEYGEGGNRIQFKIEDGTLSGSKKVIATRWDLEKMEVYDNLGAVIELAYNGTATSATLSVTASNGVATKLETMLDTVVDVSIDLTNERFATVNDIVSYLNSISGYTANTVNYRSADMPSSVLDSQSSVDIMSKGYVLAIKGDIEHQINAISDLVSVSVESPVSNTTDYIYLTGGTISDAPTSWAPGFDLIKKHFSDMLVVLSGSESVHAEALVHVQQMNNRNQKQVLFTGGLVGETVDKVKQRASVLNNSRAVLAYPGIYHKAVNNGKTILPPYFTAALIAGRVAGLPTTESVTFEYFNLIGLETDLVVGDPDINELITSGVATLEKVQNGGIRLVQGITTYIGSNNTLFREISVRRGSDELSSVMRETMEKTFIGKKGTAATTSAVETKAIDVLEKFKRDGDIADYRNIVVRFVGTVVYVEYEVAPIEPINFVLVTSHFIPDTLMSNTQ